MNVAPSPEPIFYQWRKNGVPIPGASGLCSAAGNQTYAATNKIDAVQCADSGTYSVVFANEYWKVASEGAVVTVVDAGNNPVPQATVIVTGQLPIPNPQSPPTLTATPCFPAVCAQWYQADDQFGTNKRLVATGMSYTFPSPVTCASLGYYMVEVFDAGGIGHTSIWVQVSGACQ
jgi:hypothetical protein